jgi:MFS transporter, CP family, cyanate transporter
MTTTAARTRVGPPAWVVLGGVVLVALNLRAAIAAVSPLVPELRADLGLSRGAAGLLTTLPVLCFGGLAAVSAALGRRIGNERALLVAMLAVAVGNVVRLVGSAPWLFAGTVVLGGAMAVGNVLTPSVIKEHFVRRAGAVTGIYTGALIGGAAIAAAVSAPIAATAWGWRGALLLWAVPALLAAAALIPIAGLRFRRSDPGSGNGEGPRVGGEGSARGGMRRVLRSPVTWALAVFMGAQSFGYFAVLAWLPELLEEAGVSTGRGGLALGLFNVLGIVTGMAVPAIAGQRADQRVLALTICAGWAIGVLGLLVDREHYLVWSVIAGLAQGASISLVFALIVLRSRTPEVARDLSGTVQSLGYLIGAAGPFILGALRDATRSWNVSLMALLAVIAAMTLAALRAGRSGTIG